MERRLEHEASELPLLPRRLSLSELSDGDVGAPISPLRSPGRRLLRSESTRLRANIAEHVQRDLMPAGRLFSICLVSCELVAEIAVLASDWNPKCALPLKSWTLYLMCLQIAYVNLSLLSIYYARVLSRSIRHDDQSNDELPSRASSRNEDSTTSLGRNSSSVEVERPRGSVATTTVVLERAAQVAAGVRMVNALYLILFGIGSVLVTQAGSCIKTDPDLYRLVLALTVIYYGLLGLPLACFCLMLCWLPGFFRFIPVYLSERCTRQSRMASSKRIEELPQTDFDPDNFDSNHDASCVICLNPYELGEKLRTLPCKHDYHSDCVDQWLLIDKSCPLCKQDIDSGETDADV
mmetsp:Transcript_5633/g.23885  ORF Transcript_5633/g.23885 Transcript_5633/m.23885 type:complete len:350 (-) Transcript_5633:1939-2988(-)